MNHIIDFTKLESIPEIASYLGLEASVLETVIAAGKAPDGLVKLYVRHRIPKKRASQALLALSLFGWCGFGG